MTGLHPVNTPSPNMNRARHNHGFGDIVGGVQVCICLRSWLNRIMAS